MGKANIKVARRYARALFESCSTDQLEAYREALFYLSKLWLSDAQLRGAIKNPAFPLAEREQALLSVVSAVKGQDKIMANFISVLLRNNRLAALPEIAKAFSQIIDNLQKLLSLEISSAFDLPEGEKTDLLKKVQSECGSMAKIEWKVDRDLIGGLRVKAGDKLLDGSLSGALDRFRNQVI